MNNRASPIDNYGYIIHVASCYEYKNLIVCADIRLLVTQIGNLLSITVDSTESNEPLADENVG